MHIDTVYTFLAAQDYFEKETTITLCRCVIIAAAVLFFESSLWFNVDSFHFIGSSLWLIADDAFHSIASSFVVHCYCIRFCVAQDMELHYMRDDEW